MRNNASTATNEGSDGPVGAIHGRGRQIQHDAQTLVTTLQDAANDAQHFIVDELKRNPFATLAVAAGVGYVLGGGLSARMTKVMVGVGTRLAMAVAARELSVWVDASRASKTTA